MKTNLNYLFVILFIYFNHLSAQNRAIVTTQTSEISNNLDLKAVASIFGNSRNLADFEMKLNDHKLQISNLDLNNDGLVDYLRVIEQVFNRNHIIIIQSILDRDLYQDIAAIELEKRHKNRTRILIVRNSNFYGQNYIYEPVYFNSPQIYANFWEPNYRPYCSNWSWDRYPNHYYTWYTCSTSKYQNNLSNFHKNFQLKEYRCNTNNRSIYFSGNYREPNFNGYETQNTVPNNSRSNTSLRNSYNNENQMNIEYRNNVNVAQNSKNTSREFDPKNRPVQNENSESRNESYRESIAQRTETPRNYTLTRNETSRESLTERRGASREVNYSRN